MAKTVNFDEVHERCAGIDISAQKIFVSPDGQEVKALIPSPQVIIRVLNTCKAKT